MWPVEPQFHRFTPDSEFLGRACERQPLKICRVCQLYFRLILNPRPAGSARQRTHVASSTGALIAPASACARRTGACGWRAPASALSVLDGRPPCARLGVRPCAHHTNPACWAAQAVAMERGAVQIRGARARPSKWRVGASRGRGGVSKCPNAAELQVGTGRG